MLIFKITITLKGENFSPQMFTDFDDNFIVIDRNETNDLIWENRTNRYDFGSITIISKSVFILKNELTLYEKKIADFFRVHIESLRSHGLSEINYNLDIFYSDFCSFELSNSENYSFYGEVLFSIPINVYKIKEKEIIDMLLEVGYSESQIHEHEW